MADDLTLTRDGLVAVLEIRRPPANYFDRTLIGLLAEAADELDEDKDCRAIVLCSEGKHFCAGANFGGDEMGGDRIATSEALYRHAVRLFRIKVPVIAAVQGSAVGGGLGLACAADFRVASPSSRFHANFSLLGFHQGFGLSVTLPEIVGQQRAMDMLFASRRISGERAAEIGLVDRLVPDDAQRDEAMRWAQEIADAAPLAVRSIKQTLRGDLADRVSAALDRELSEQAWLWSTKDSAAGIAANLERRKAVFSAH
ncbi:enoyl-CoA hydratase/isomerase family protein [Blastococcus sp. BMG 814]|uniref:Enoyl-CoA hydratase/isomerase family protein n=1 Tax=Blastococcus carthaginiensis TaxID=3050034 RepID=A0ABT9IE70_9ACTN|nr:enoyl-CoA hydratase/isomerase family protein [Blastococcus carthaginiensis]MDP5183884.1 enoyl-CoA hydratase/isomerase family protein [Blastococcus carthaginiensis]